jgi:hypothetical protein
MEPWKLVLDEAAFRFFNGLRATERRNVLRPKWRLNSSA